MNNWKKIITKLYKLKATMNKKFRVNYNKLDIYQE
jgi:hypothetical protein